MLKPDDIRPAPRTRYIEDLWQRPDAPRRIRDQHHVPRGAGTEGRIWWTTHVRVALGHPSPWRVAAGLLITCTLLAVLVAVMAMGRG